MANRPTPRTPRRATLAGMPPSPPETAPKPAQESAQAPAPEAPPKRKPGRPRKASTEGTSDDRNA